MARTGVTPREGRYLQLMRECVNNCATPLERESAINAFWRKEIAELERDRSAANATLADRAAHLYTTLVKELDGAPPCECKICREARR